MRRACLTVAALLLLGSASAAIADEDLHVVIPSFIIHAEDQHEFTAKAGAEANLQIWTWTPRAVFFLAEDLPSGGVLEAEYLSAKGKPWITVPCRDGGSNGIVCGGQSEDIAHEKYSRETGSFAFKIHYKNELTGVADKVIFAGTFKVDKYYDGRTAADYKKEDKDCFEYFVDYDWAMPLGYLSFIADNGAPALQVWMWFKFGPEEPNENNFNAHVFYQGKEVCASLGFHSEPEAYEQIDTDNAAGRYGWSKHLFMIPLCQVKLENPELNPRAFQVDKNPGEYEVKVLWNGKLARVGKFTVNADGTIANPLGDKNPQLHTSRRVMPVQILGDQDYKFDKTAWKTGMNFGNPVTDFVAP